MWESQIIILIMFQAPDNGEPAGDKADVELVVVPVKETIVPMPVQEDIILVVVKEARLPVPVQVDIVMVPVKETIVTKPVHEVKQSVGVPDHKSVDVGVPDHQESVSVGVPDQESVDVGVPDLETVTGAEEKSGEIL